MSDFDFRFGGLGRLFGVEGLARLRRAHVCVVGIGGVGSWTVEALARSGIGAITMVDLDEVCVSNVNRQLHALNSEVGRAKAEVMAARIREINPECEVRVALEFFTAENSESLLAPRYDFVVDAIDSMTNKCLLIARCHAAGTPVITCGGAGGRRDPTQIRVTDLGRTSHDRLLCKVREILRKQYGFPHGGHPFGVPAVFSSESPTFPGEDGTVCAQRKDAADGARKLNCDSGYGTASFVTGTFGFVAAGHVVERIAAGQLALPV